ncbi:MAG: mRNA cap guanine-N7 methyltransferase [Chaenotheca gracillima]|nr:MAG: mRNA cap guanine-N7 methyltransferase [Chaenotheca gracillima]
MFGSKKNTKEEADFSPDRVNAPQNDVPLDTIEKGRWERLWPVIACGAGLFSDGYLNNVIGSVNTILGKLYPDEYAGSAASQNVASITFAGTVLGQLIFGWFSDHYSRKWSLLASTIILIIFAALAAGSYGAGGSISGLFAALTAYRFFLGIGIGGEYPAGSVACAETSGELKSGTRNRWFILFTNVQIDFGFVVSAIVPMILVLICTENHLRLVWRISLGLGVVPPLSLLWLRIKLKEPEEFRRETMREGKFPWKLILRFYWYRLMIVSAIWFLYDFSAYSFGIYSTTILSNVLGDTAPLWKTFGWNVVINLFYMPGCIGGSFVSDWIGPRYTLALGVFAQGIIGYIMAGCYATLAVPSHVAGFVVVYGIFLTLGELGPGDNIGLVASKTCATCVRGQYYAIAAAFGKIGAFVGSYVFPIIQKNAANPTASGQNPFWVASSLCLLSTALAIFCLPHIGQDTITTEDIKFRAFLSENGYDTSQMGVKELQGESVDSLSDKVVNEKPVEKM